MREFGKSPQQLEWKRGQKRVSEQRGDSLVSSRVQTNCKSRLGGEKCFAHPSTFGEGCGPRISVLGTVSSKELSSPSSVMPNWICQVQQTAVYFWSLLESFGDSLLCSTAAFG